MPVWPSLAVSQLHWIVAEAHLSRWDFAAARRAAITSQQLMTEADLLSPPTWEDTIEWCALHVLLGELCDADGDAPRACVEFEQALGLVAEIESKRGGGGVGHQLACEVPQCGGEGLGSLEGVREGA